MPGGSLLALLDDIASILDDVAVLTKVAAKKTAGVLGDDLALNAQQVSGVSADRELPVVFAVAKGSLVNKAILVPAALAISAFIPWAVTPLLMIGGAFLCFEGAEKVLHVFFPHADADADAHAAAGDDHGSAPVVSADPKLVEKDKIKGAIRTDFILSAEIIAIALGTVASTAFVTQVVVLVAVALVMTVGVYGLVAGIVKLDDAGLYLSKRPGAFARAVGAALLGAAPLLMKALSVGGTFAMFLVGGGILTHGLPPVHHAIEAVAAAAHAVPGIGAILAWLVAILGDLVVGAILGALVVAAVTAVKKLRATRRK